VLAQLVTLFQAVQSGDKTDLSNYACDHVIPVFVNSVCIPDEAKSRALASDKDYVFDGEDQKDTR
jgi:hypothetical protein